MFEINRKEFGAFVSALRKEQGLTQKELAEKLFISDKAVSKWETGVSIPDTQLLIPLAEALHVTVTELLECRRSENDTMDISETETLVQKALHFGSESTTRPNWRKHAPMVGACAVLAAFEDILLLRTHQAMAPLTATLLLMYLLPLIFSIYFCCFIRETLPRYYDENRITAYSDGFFRMNLVGIAFNNRNWPYIVKVGRTWSLFTLVGTPLVLSLLSIIFPSGDDMQWAQLAVLMLYLGGLFIPMVYVAKKYE